MPIRTRSVAIHTTPADVNVREQRRPEWRWAERN